MSGEGLGLLFPFSGFFVWMALSFGGQFGAICRPVCPVGQRGHKYMGATAGSPSSPLARPHTVLSGGRHRPPPRTIIPGMSRAEKVSRPWGFHWRDTEDRGSDPSQPGLASPHPSPCERRRAFAERLLELPSSPLSPITPAWGVSFLSGWSRSGERPGGS